MKRFKNKFKSLFIGDTTNTSSNLRWDKRIHKQRVFTNPYKDKIKEGPIWTRSFHLPLYFGWEVVFTVQKIGVMARQIVGPFKSYRGFITTVIILIVITSGIFFFVQNTGTEAATFLWQQSTWTGGVTVNDANHTDDRTSWTEYSAKDSNVAAASDVALTQSTTSIIETSDADFNAGAVSSTKVGQNSLALAPDEVNEAGFVRDVYPETGVGVWVGSDRNGVVSLKLYSAASTELLKNITLSSGYAMFNNSIVRQPSTDFVWVGAVKNGDFYVLKVNTNTNTEIAQYLVNSADSMSLYGMVWDSSTGSLWAVNGNAHVVYKIDPADGSQIGRYSVGTSPRGITFDSSTNSIWTPNYSTDNITKIAAADGSEAVGSPYTAGDAPNSIVFDSSTNSIWVGHAATNVGVKKFSAANGSETGTYNPTSTTIINSLAFDSDNNYVAVYGTSRLTRLQAANGSEVDQRFINQWSSHIDYCPDNDSIYIYGTTVGFDPMPYGSIMSQNIYTGLLNNSEFYSVAYDDNSKSFWITDVTIAQKIRQFSLDSNTITNTYSIGTYMYGIAYNSQDNTLWGSDRNNDLIHEINPSDGTIIDSYATGDGPWIVYYVEANNTIWTNNYLDDTFTVLNGNTGALINTYSYTGLGSNPSTIYEDFTQSLWTVASNEVIKIDPTDGSEKARYAVQGASQIAFDTYTNSIWVSRGGYDRISKLDPTDGTLRGDYYTVDSTTLLTFDDVTNHLWFFNVSDGFIGRMNVVDGTQYDRYQKGYQNPNTILFNSYTNSVWSIAPEMHNFMVAWYANAGTFTSQILNTGGNTGFGNVSWNASVPTNTTLSVKVRSDSSSDMSGATAWASCNTISSGSDMSSHNCVTDGHQYIQYQVTFGTTDTSVTPTLSDITLEYLSYTNGTLTSSSYDAGDATNVLTDITWAESGTGEVKFQIRTSANNSTWTDWMGPTGTGDYYTNPAGGNNINSAHEDASGDRYVQYQATIESTNAINTPTLAAVNTQYVVNGGPEYDPGNPSIAAQRTSDGQVVIDYWVRDQDNSSVTPSFEYTLNGSDPSPSWDTISSTYLDAGATDSKAVDNVTYTQYTAIWDAKTHIDGQYSADTKIRITADDGELANNTGVTTTAAFTLDVTDPNLGGEPIIVDATTSPATITLAATDNSALEYKISLNADLTGASWQTYSANTTITLATDPDIVYVQFRDAVKNTSTIQSETSPGTPDDISSDDISVATSSSWRTFITWGLSDLQLSDFAYYRVYYSTDGTTYQLLLSENDKTKNYYLHTSLTQNQQYYYKVFVEKTNGSKSSYTPVVSATTTGQGGSDSAPPTISNVASTSITTQSATVTWDTEELSDSKVTYSTTPGVFTTETAVTSMVDNSSNYGPHQVVLTGLAPDTTYYYQATSADPVGNTSTDNNGGNGYSFTTLTGPTISLVTPSNISNISASISWVTNIAADTTIYYSANSDFTNPTTISTDESVTAHKVMLSELSAATKYYYYVESDTARDDNAGRYYTFVTTNDTTAPTISDQSVVIITDSKAVAQWSTDEPATTVVQYGATSGNLTETVTDTSLNYLHLVILSNLAADTTYYYKVTSADASGNSVTSSESTFQTLPADADSQTLEDLNNSILEILSETTDETLEQTLIEQQEAIDQLAELIPSPIIQGEPRVDEKSTTATIAWGTDKEANAIISYSSDETYGQSIITPYQHQVGSPDSFNTEHALTLTNLEPETTYHYQIRTKGVASGETTSPDYTFTTEKKSFGIENYSVEKLSNEQAVFSWVTTEKSNSILSFTPYRENVLAVDEKSVVTDDNLNLIHQIEIDTFESGVVYLVELQSVAENDNISLVTLETFTTSEENTPPVISQIQTDSALSPGSDPKVQTIVSWTTNEPATSRVLYRKGVGGDEAEFDQQSQLDTNYTKDHVVVLTSFDPGSVYQFRAESTDSNGQTALSKPLTILTPQQEQTVFEVIFGAVEDTFGWLRIFNR